MDIATYVLEFAVYAVPLTVSLFVLYTFYSRKGKFLNLFYDVLFLLPILTIITTVKLIIILNNGVNEVSFLIGNVALFLVLCIFVLAIIKEFKTETPFRLSKLEILLFFLLIIGAIFIKEPFKFLDFLVYGSIPIFSVRITLVLLKLSKTSTKLKKISIAPATLLLADTLLKFLYYINLIPLYPTIQISLSLRLSGILLLVLFAYVIEKDVPQSEISPEVMKARKKTMRRAGILTVLVLAVTIGMILRAYAYCVNYKDTQEKVIDTSIQYYSNNLHDNLNNLLQHEFIDHLMFISKDPEMFDAEKRIQLIKNFYETHRNIFASVTFTNNRGIIEYTYPFTALIGNDISNQPHVKEVLKEKTIVISEPFMAVQGFPAFIAHIPLFDNGKFIGTIAGLIDIRNISSFIAPQRAKEDFVIFEDEIVLSTNTTTPVLKEESAIISGDFENKYYSHKSFFSLYNRNFAIYVFENKSLLSNELRNVVISQALQVGAMTIVLLFVLYLFTLTLRREDLELGDAVENALSREREQFKKTEDAQLKLSQLNAFIYTITFRESEEEFFNKLLNLSIDLIPHAEKGSAWIKRGEFHVPIAGVGYDSDKLRLLKISESALIDRWQNKWKGGEAHIETDIADQNYPQEGIQINEVTGTDIKATLCGAIKVENKYYGSIYIDNTQTKNAFNEDDIEIILGISKIASFYLTTKKLLEDIITEQKSLLETTNRLKTLLDFQARISFLESEERFYSELLTLSLSITPHAQKGTILIKENSSMKYIAAEGYNIHMLNKMTIPVEVEKAIVEQGKILVIKHLTSKDDGLSEDSKRIIEIEGLNRTKSTITAPIFVGNDYYGGVFLDNLDSEDIFDEGDINVTRAISNIASLYARTRELLKERKKINLANKIVVEVIDAIGKAKGRKDAIESAYYSLFKIFPWEIKEICVMMRIENTYVSYESAQDYSNFEELEEIPPLLTKIIVPTLVKKEENDLIKTCFKKHPIINAAYVVPIIKDKYFLYGFSGTSLKNEEKDILEEVTYKLSGVIENFELLTERQISYVETLIALAKTIDSKDPYTKRHSEGVATFSYITGRVLGISKEELRTLFLASMLHDIGKISIPDHILQKQGALTKEEYEVIKKHPVTSAEIIKSISFLRGVPEIVMFHHERIDGKGYPLGLNNGGIPLLSRIITVADAFDAMITDRPYRKAKTYEEALEELQRFKGTQFDTDVVDAFASISLEEIKKAHKKLDTIGMFRELIGIYYE